MNNLVKITNNQVTTSSRTIAEIFGKKHKDVLRIINNLEIPQDFIERNFAPYTYLAENNKKNPYYEITRDGFTLLAMGFTGKKAIEWKIKYINAFNAMEKALTEKSDKPVIVSEHTRALPSGKKEIVLSDKAKTEIGGIVKAVLQAELTQRGAIKDVLREVIREEIADYNLKGGITATDNFNTAPTADGLPIANWLVGINHAVGAINTIYGQLRERQNQVLKLLGN